MSDLNIYIDVNYPKALTDALMQIHSLQKENKYQLISWSNQSIRKEELMKSIILLVDYQKKGIGIPIIKHYEAGYKVFVLKAGQVKMFDRFEFAMTVLQMWPSIIEKGRKVNSPFLCTFRYMGKRLSVAKII